MNKFKVGDRVIRTSGGNSMPVGAVSTITKIECEKLTLKDYEPEQDMNFNEIYFKLYVSKSWKERLK